MAVHKLFIDAFEDSAYEAVAIHTTLEPYRLAFFINKTLGLLLHKKFQKVDVPKGFDVLECFYYEESHIEVVWWLFENRQESNAKTVESGLGLFAEEVTKSNIFVLPEFKQSDFILKIDGNIEQIDMASLLKKIQKISSVSTVYTLPQKKIKNKNNLIFT
jgi:hypothetical protein